MARLLRLNPLLGLKVFLPGPTDPGTPSKGGRDGFGGGGGGLGSGGAGVGRAVELGGAGVYSAKQVGWDCVI